MVDDAKMADLFTKYVEHTDGKRKIANSVADVFFDLKERTLLDVGAGSGHVAMHLVPLVREIVCIEPNTDLFDQMTELLPSHVHSVNTSLEDWDEDRQFDIVLLAYLLDTYYGDPKLPLILDAASERVKPGGSILVASYIEGCDWDVFTERVGREIGVTRRGGYARNVEQIRTSGYYHRVRNMFTSHIFGESVEQLYFNLAFFFKRRLDQYLDAKEAIVEELGRLATSREGHWSIELTEVVFSIEKAEPGSKG